VGFEVQQVEEVVGAGDGAAAEDETGEADSAGGAGPVVVAYRSASGYPACVK
jgi:hypothetical protein